jgi:hypothetical protein
MEQAVAGMFYAVADGFSEKLQPTAAQSAEKAGADGQRTCRFSALWRVPSYWAKAHHRDPTRIPTAIRWFRLSLAARIAESA